MDLEDSKGLVLHFSEIITHFIFNLVEDSPERLFNFSLDPSLRALGLKNRFRRKTRISFEKNKIIKYLTLMGNLLALKTSYM